MARGDKPYFRVEVAFVNSAEFLRLSPEALKLYLFLMARCIEDRKSTVYRVDHSYLAHHTGLSRQRVPYALAELDSCLYGKGEHPLTSTEPRGKLLDINVESVKRNNLYYKWSDSPSCPHPVPILSPLNRTDNNREETPTPSGQGEQVTAPASGSEGKKQGLPPKADPPPASAKNPEPTMPEPEEFKKFMEVYPHSSPKRRTNPIMTQKQWGARIAEGYPGRDMTAGAAAYRDELDVAGEGYAYAKGAQVFIGRDLHFTMYLTKSPTPPSSRPSQPSSLPTETDEERELRERNMAVVKDMYAREKKQGEGGAE